MKKFVCIMLGVGIVFNLIFAQIAFAQAGTTILPEPDIFDCDTVLEVMGPIYFLMPPSSNDSQEINNIIYCAVKNGQIHGWMIPYFIKYLAEFLIGIAGILCMLFIVIGGYQYTIGGFVEEKEKGKNTIFYSAIGLALVFLSWAIVNVVLYVFTN